LQAPSILSTGQIGVVLNSGPLVVFSFHGLGIRPCASVASSDAQMAGSPLKWKTQRFGRCFRVQKLLGD
jgi:hypothetical protein